MHFFERSFSALLDDRGAFKNFYDRIEIAMQRGKVITI